MSKLDVFHVEGEGEDSPYKDNEISEWARIATDMEHSLTVREGLKLYPKAIFWAIVLSLTIIMEGYDDNLIGNFYAYPTFQKKYGVPLDGGYSIPARWQTALGNGASVGSTIGIFANGWLTERYGHRRVILVSLVFLVGFIFIPFFAKNLTTLLVGEILCGLPWGVFVSMGPSYSSEICPTALRGYLTAYVNMCWAIGQFISAGVLKGLVSNTTEWGYKIPFAIQWFWPIPLFILTYLAPDSPWWLIRKGRIRDAEKAQIRLTSGSAKENAHFAVAMMVHTNKLEEAADTKSSYWDCFKRSNLRRTEIACCSMGAHAFTGSTFAYSPTYFFSLAGVSTTVDYDLGLVGTAIAFLGTCFSWVMINLFGRRTIYLGGFFLMALLLLLIGVLSFPAENNGSIMYVQAGLTLAWIATYSSTIGPVSFSILSEVSATRIRPQTIALGNLTNSLLGFVCGAVEPKLINPSDDNLKGKTALFWFGAASIAFTWIFFRLPETKGRTYEELDLMFERKISAKKFRDYSFDDLAVEQNDHNNE